MEEIKNSVLIGDCAELLKQYPMNNAPQFAGFITLLMITALGLYHIFYTHESSKFWTNILPQVWSINLPIVINCTKICIGSLRDKCKLSD